MAKLCLKKSVGVQQLKGLCSLRRFKLRLATAPPLRYGDVRCAHSVASPTLLLLRSRLSQIKYSFIVLGRADFMNENYNTVEINIEITDDLIYDWKIGLDIPSTRRRIAARFPSPPTLEILKAIFPTLSKAEIEKEINAPVDIKAVANSWREKLTTDNVFAERIFSHLQTYEAEKMTAPDMEVLKLLTTYSQNEILRKRGTGVTEFNSVDFFRNLLE